MTANDAQAALLRLRRIAERGNDHTAWYTSEDARAILAHIDALTAAAERVAVLEAENERLRGALRKSEAHACDVSDLSEWAETERDRMSAALQQIATGKITGEPNNHRDTLAIIREIACAALNGEKA
jgi:hypothetical protein